jgi:hypothetical protein
MDYTTDQLRTQLAIAEREMSNEQSRLASLDRIPADVRDNHRRTIQMRIAHYRARIESLRARLT